jgi:hypothetical protein
LEEYIDLKSSIILLETASDKFLIRIMTQSIFASPPSTSSLRNWQDHGDFKTYGAEAGSIGTVSNPAFAALSYA